MSTTLRTAAAVIALTLGAVGCGGDDEKSEGAADAPAAGDTISISAKEFAFDPAEVEVAAGSEFTIEVTNEGVIEHDLSISGYESEKIVTPVGKTATGSFTLDAGTYEFFCAVAGHKESGMKGTLTVK